MAVYLHLHKLSDRKVRGNFIQMYKVLKIKVTIFRGLKNPKQIFSRNPYEKREITLVTTVV